MKVSTSIHFSVLLIGAFIFRVVFLGFLAPVNNRTCFNYPSFKQEVFKAKYKRRNDADKTAKSSNICQGTNNAEQLSIKKSLGRFIAVLKKKSFFLLPCFSFIVTIKDRLLADLNPSFFTRHNTCSKKYLSFSIL
ncbi:MAG TPA: hypothetical protein VNY73_06985, partial [Bacteroidia bacterium]|nr:hypothetical protein [Bacteroidia bacterium]